MTVCYLHFIGFTGTSPEDCDRSFDRVPCIGEDVLIEGNADTWRVVGVVWATDKPMLELSRVVR